MSDIDTALEACWQNEVARCARLGVPLPNKDRHLNMTAKYVMQQMLLESCEGDQAEIDFVLTRSRWFTEFPEQRVLYEGELAPHP